MCLLLLPVLPKAQQKDFYFTRLTENDGLTDNHINCIMQDHKGYIWVGTFYGLNRYDGYTVDRFLYNAADTNSITDNFVSTLAEDKNGKLWIGTAKGGGLANYNPVTKKFKRFYHNPGNKNSLPDNQVNEIFVDSKNRLWIGFFGEGWCVYDQQEGVFTHYRSGNVRKNGYSVNTHNIIEAFAEDKTGNMWIASNAGLYYQDTKTGTITEYRDSVRGNSALADNLFTSMYAEGDSVLWLGTWAAGLKKFNIPTHTYSQYLFDKVNPAFGVTNIVLKIARKSPEELWVGSADKGIGIFNTRYNSFRFFPNDPSNPNSPLPSSCNCVFTDMQNSLWAGHDMGVTRWAGQSSNFQFYPITNFVHKYHTIGINCFYKDAAAGLLYTGGEGGKGLYIINEKTGRQEIISFPDENNFSGNNYTITSIAAVDVDRLLLLAGNGLYFFYRSTKKIQKITITDQEGKQVIPGFGLFKTAGKKWWYSTWSRGCYVIDSSLQKAFHYYAGNVPGLKNFGSIVLAENDSLIWINNNITGLNIFNSVTKTVQPVILVNANFFISSAVNMIPAKSNQYWLTSYAQGLYQLTKNPDNTFSYRHFGEIDGIPSAFMKGIIKDRDNNYWVTTRKGPVMYSPQKKHFKLFGESEGYKAAQWVFEDVYTANDGMIYFTAVGGYVRAVADSLNFNTNSSPLVIKSFQVLGKEWNDTADLASVKQITLPYNHNFFNIEFALLNYVGAQNNKYACMLKGADKEFINLGNRRFISYADLEPGTYTLFIKAANNDVVWNDKMIALNIVIEPPFWRTWIFYVLTAILIGSIVFTGYRYHINNIRKAEKLKTDFTKKVAEIEMKALRAQMNPHFIFNCLNSINRYIIKSDHITASGYLTRFSKLIRLILDNSIADTTTLENEVQLVHLYLEMEELRYDGRFTYRIEIEPALLSETIMIPSMLIQPYAENAIWHGLLHKAGTGHLAINFKLHEINILKIDIEDNGVGRARSAELKSKNALKNKSYGMQITGDRINIVNRLYNMKASAIVQDMVNTDGTPAGTKVSLLIPFERVETKNRL